MEKFLDRQQAGKFLAENLKDYANKPDVIVLALPRGGVPVAYEMAIKLNVPLDIFLVRKIGVPWHDELAMGAIASGGSVIFNDEIIKSLNITQDQIEHVIQAEKKELQRRELVYRGKKNPLNLKNKTIILVDDGIATGASIKAAIRAIKQQHPAQLIVAVPVVAYSTYRELKKLADNVVCLLKPRDLVAVGLWYDNFAQTQDDEVMTLLKQARKIVSDAYSVKGHTGFKWRNLSHK